VHLFNKCQLKQHSLCKKFQIWSNIQYFINLLVLLNNRQNAVYHILNKINCANVPIKITYIPTALESIFTFDLDSRETVR
jgi:hypothetical protein